MKLRSKEILIAYMKEQDFSLGRLARYAGCSRSMISHLTSGRKTSCTGELADRIAEALHAPTAALFDERTSASSGDDDKNARKVAA